MIVSAEALLPVIQVFKYTHFTLTDTQILLVIVVGLLTTTHSLGCTTAVSVTIDEIGLFLLVNSITFSPCAP